MERPIQRIAIIGMGRSGTSFLTRFLGKSGVYLGELPNKFGKYEHPLGRGINEEILAECFGAREGLPYGRLPTAEIDVDERWRPRVAEFVEYMDRMATSNGASGYWAFKDPRTTILHSLWIDDFDIEHSTFQLETKDRRRLEDAAHA